MEIRWYCTVKSMHFEKVMYAQIYYPMLIEKITFMASQLGWLAARFTIVLLHIPQL